MLLNRISLVGFLLLSNLQVLAATTGLYLPGAHHVEVSGAASYSIPIATPLSTGSISPSLSLSYSSHGGVGKLGKGWGLAGLSTITRCGQTQAQDGDNPTGVAFDAQDRFCMDGQRLILLNGTAYGAHEAEYRTEQDTFSKIISYGAAGVGPSYFKVWTKAGQILEYGATASSRIELPGLASVRVWAINKVSDRKSNYMRISYTREAGEYYPERIDYTGNDVQGNTANNAVIFNYEIRPDPLISFMSGSLLRSNYRLKNIKTFADNKQIFEYKLSYLPSNDSSRLRNITLCDSAGICLPPTTVTWQDASVGLTPGTWRETGFPAHQMAGAENSALTLIDINNDGKMDFVQPIDRDGGLWLVPFLATENGFSEKKAFRLDFPSYFSVGDFNGDGKQDLLTVLAVSPNGFKYKVLFGDGEVFTEGPVFVADQNCAIPNILDVNGDGRDDLVAVCTLNLVGDQVALQMMISNGVSFVKSERTPLSWATSGPGYVIDSFYKADLNGDGKDDMIEVFRRQGAPGNLWVRPIISNGNRLVPGNWQDSGIIFYDPSNDNNTVSQITPMDANGDGLTDLVFSRKIFPFYSIAEVTIIPFYSTGSQFERGTEVRIDKGVNFPPYQVSEGLFALSLIPTDLNGDGRIDLVQAWGATNRDGGVWTPGELFLQPIFSTSAGFVPQDALPTGQSRSTIKYNEFDSEGNIYLQDGGPGLIFGDFNGDGKADVIQQKYTNNTGTLAFVNYDAAGLIGDLVVKIENGIGKSIIFDYRPLTDNSIYTKFYAGISSSYPINDVQNPLYVVVRATESDGRGGGNSIEYKYAGYKKDLLRRQSLGFKSIESRDVSRGTVRKVVARQDWPFIGMAEKTETWLTNPGGNFLLEQQDNFYGCTDFVSASGCPSAPNRRYFAFLEKTVDISKDLNGAVFPTVETKLYYENWNQIKSSWNSPENIYGNIAEIIVSTSDGYTKKIKNSYKNDSSRWIIGKTISITETNISP